MDRIATGLCLSVIIPAYNEAKNIEPMFLRARGTIGSSFTEIEWIFVDDGSIDDTHAVMQQLLMKDKSIKICKLKKNSGIGAAIWHGLQAATNQWVTWLPADGQIDPNVVVSLSQAVITSDFTIAIRIEEHKNICRRFISKFAALLFYLMFRVRLTGFSGIFFVQTSQVRKIELFCTTPLQNYAMVLFCLKNGMQMGVAKTIVLPRLSGSSKVGNLRTIICSMLDIFKLRKLSKLIKSPLSNPTLRD